MTDLSFDAADITAAIQKNLEGFDPSVESGTVGRILEVGDLSLIHISEPTRPY